MLSEWRVEDDFSGAVPNEYFIRKLKKDTNLVTTLHGSWLILNDDEVEKLENGDVGGFLFRELERTGIILTKKSLSFVINSIRMNNHMLKEWCSFWVIGITDRCTRACKYCHASAKFCPSSQKSKISELDGEMKKETADKILDFIFSTPNNRNEIIIEGGETLLRWDLIKHIFKRAKSLSKKHGKRLRISLGTNLDLMTDDIAREMKEIGMTTLCTSLDGPKKIHEKMRGGPYENIIYWTKRLENKYGIRVSHLPVLTKYTVENVTPKDFVDCFLEIGEEIVFFKPIKSR